MTNERKPERGSVRQSVTNQGPQYVPTEYLDENFHYRWVNYVQDKLWTAIEKERLGYEPVPVSEINSHIKSKIIKEQGIAKEGYVTCPLKNGGQSVLMRIDKNVYLDRKKFEKEDRDASYQNMVREGLEMASDGTKKTFSFTNTK